MSAESMATLEKALELSRQMLTAADRGDSAMVEHLDAERRLLLKSLKRSPWAADAAERVLLQEIGLLNDRSIGHLEHHRRTKGRQLDVAVAGRRAVHAYSNTRQLR
jgi:hypothetical protein